MLIIITWKPLTLNEVKKSCTDQVAKNKCKRLQTTNNLGREKFRYEQINVLLSLAVRKHYLGYLSLRVSVSTKLSLPLYWSAFYNDAITDFFSFISLTVDYVAYFVCVTIQTHTLYVKRSVQLSTYAGAVKSFHMPRLQVRTGRVAIFIKLLQAP